MNKKLIAILTLVMFALTLLPMGAFAASKNDVTGNIPTVTQTGNFVLANLRISADGIADNFGATATQAGVFTLDLPSGLNWYVTPAPAPAAPFNTDAAADIQTQVNNLAGVAGATAVRSGSRTITVTIPAGSTIAAGDFINVPVKVEVTSVGTGDIAVTLTDVSSGVTPGEFVVGRFATGAATARALSTSTVAGSATLGTIRITENSAGALGNSDTIKIQLPQKMSWNTGYAVGATVSTPAAGTGLLTYVAGNNTRTLELQVATAPGSGTRIWDIVTPVTIDSDAKKGDINVTFSGTANVDTTSIKIGALKDYEVDVFAKDSKELLAGRASVEAGKIVIKEGLSGSIVAGRDIKIKLPSGVKFATGITPNTNTVAGSVVAPVIAAGDINTDRNELTFRTTGPSGSATEFEVRGIELAIAANFTGDVEVEVTGAAGVTGKAVIATVKKPISVQVSNLTDVEIGKQGQSIGDITIKEVKAEALISGGSIILKLPTNAEWASLPTVEVVEGDMDLGTIAKSGNLLTIPVDSEGSVPVTIKITKAAVTTNRTIAEGDINVSIVGSTGTDNSAAVVELGALMANRNTAVSFKVGTVVTPAGEGTVKPVVMTVGSTVYTIDGIEMTMDVAPYIKDARTYFPVRYVAQALGITADNVVWDGAQRTVTIFRANRIVQVTIGSSTMLVNGVPLTMDAAPEITAERTMLPIRFVAQGLGVNVNWDAATQTVTLN